MTRRVVLGKQQNGGYALRVSLPGVDALTADANNPNQLSFNSDWTDLARIHQMGQAYVYAAPPPTTYVYFLALGGIPFVECKYIDAYVHDDYAYAFVTGVSAPITNWQTWIRCQAYNGYVGLSAGGAGNVPWTCQYVIFKDLIS